MFNRYKNDAYTLGEILVVISIVSIMVIGSLTGTITLFRRAQNARAHDDIATIAKGIAIARANSGKTLTQIIQTIDSGQYCTECSCRSQPPEVLMNKTSTCWTKYKLAIDAINNTAGFKVIDGYPENQWGAPYLINQNEGEGPGGGCVDLNTDGFACCEDNLADTGLNQRTVAWYDSDDIVVNVGSLCFPSEGSHHPDQN